MSDLILFLRLIMINTGLSWISTMDPTGSAFVCIPRLLLHSFVPPRDENILNHQILNLNFNRLDPPLLNLHILQPLSELPLPTLSYRL